VGAILMTLKEEIQNEIYNLAQDPKVVFIGYNTKNGSRMSGLLAPVTAGRCIETPVAENLMCGLAMGMSLEGYKPVLCFERMDFMLACADAIINHMVKLPYLSGRQFSFPIIILSLIGDAKPLNPGTQHIGDYRHIFQKYMTCVHIEPGDRELMRLISTVCKSPVLLTVRKEDLEKEALDAR
jgi:pyruvate/2-oxoglutarate/acetoin dehydrogenase E1 component